MTDAVRYDGFPDGVDSLRADFDLPDGALRLGVNVDILKSGKVRRRRGIEQVIADADAHSVFADATRIIYATPTALKMASRNFEVTTLRESALFADPLSYVALHGEIYYSNEAINGKITADSQAVGWGITGPTTAPTLAATTGERFVQVTCAFVTDTGEISGAPEASVVTCQDSPSILVSAIPQSSDARVVATRLYVSDLDGTVFYAYADVPAGRTTYMITGELARGEVLRTQFMEPPPPGQLLEYIDGRIYIASGSNVFRTQPLRYGLYLPDEDFLMYPERVTLLKAVEGGIFVSADATYFEAGIGTPDVVHKPVLPYKAIEGAHVSLPDSHQVAWLSERGIVVGSAGGGVKNLTEDRIALPGFERAAMGVIEHNGHKALVAIAKEETSASPLLAEDYAEADAARLADLQ